MAEFVGPERRNVSLWPGEVPDCRPGAGAQDKEHSVRLRQLLEKYFPSSDKVEEAMSRAQTVGYLYPGVVHVYVSSPRLNKDLQTLGPRTRGGRQNRKQSHRRRLKLLGCKASSLLGQR